MNSVRDAGCALKLHATYQSPPQSWRFSCSLANELKPHGMVLESSASFGHKLGSFALCAWASYIISLCLFASLKCGHNTNNTGTLCSLS